MRRLSVGSILEWNDVDRCRLLIALSLPFFAAYALRSAYLIAHPGIEPYYDRQALVWVRNGLAAITLFWVGLLALGARVRRRPGSHRLYLALAALSWWLGVSATAYALGPITSPAWIAIVIGGVTHLLLLPLGIALAGIAGGLALSVAGLALSASGIVPYAPLVTHPPIGPGGLALSYVVGNAIVSVAATLLILGVVGLILHEWRKALQRLERTNRELEETVRDRTRELALRKHAEEQQRRLEGRIQQTQKLESLGVLAGGIAHDFNNLLVPLLGNARLAALELPEDTPARRYIDRVETAARRASELTGTLLAYAGRGSHAREPVDLGKLLRETLELLRAAIPPRIELLGELPETPLGVTGDPGQLRQVLLNLITNAAEAIGENAGRVSVRCRMVRAERAWLRELDVGHDLPEGDYVEIEVRDNGCGMDEETRSRMFDPFFTTKFAGRGLGLAALLGIVRSHGGGLRVESELGKGTRFRVLLPQAEKAPRRAEPSSHEGWSWKQSGSILVVDDDEAVLELLCEVIPRCGLRVIAARSGAQALELYRKHAPSIVAVLLDVTMPEMGGEEVLEEIHRLRPDARVILSSGYSDVQPETMSGEAGRTGFLKKPFSPEQVIEALRQALEG